MRISHHVSDTMLADYASGDLSETWSIAVATHLALCPRCRDDVRRLEALHGLALEAIEPAPMSASSWLACAAQLDAALDHDVRRKAERCSTGGDIVVPQPLRSVLGGDVGSLKWRSVGGGIRQKAIETNDGVMARIIDVPPDVKTPAHRHTGAEFTLVLAGGYHDGAESFTRGDVQIIEDSRPHQPVAMSDAPCIVFAVNQSPISFVDTASRVLSSLFLA